MSGAAADWREVAARVRAVLGALDWQALGEIYFHWGGERFWRERRPRVQQLGERLARALLPRLVADGASLWVGAGVAELPVLLAEAMRTRRTVVATNLRAAECELLAAGLAAAAPGVSLRFVAEDARTAAAPAVFDHLGCISVFTDPETWPVLSDVAYGRIAPVQLDVARFVQERDEARALAAGLFARLRRPGLVTTSAEEAAWFLEQAERAGATIAAVGEMIDTAVVGDPVGFLDVA